MELFEPDSFFEKNTQDLFYVGFLKGPKAWFPFCMVSDPRESSRLDILPLSCSHDVAKHMVEEYSRRIELIEQTFVQYMTRQEILDLMKYYGLKRLTLISGGFEEAGCGCGCGCS